DRRQLRAQAAAEIAQVRNEVERSDRLAAEDDRTERLDAFAVDPAAIAVARQARGDRTVSVADERPSVLRVDGAADDRRTGAAGATGWARTAARLRRSSGRFLRNPMPTASPASTYSGTPVNVRSPRCRLMRAMSPTSMARSCVT